MPRKRELRLKCFPFHLLGGVALIITLVACSPQKGPLTASSTPTASSKPAPTLSPTPFLAKAPSNCPVTISPHVLSSAILPVVGKAPVWATLPLVVHIPSYTTYTFPYGWTFKVIWEIGPNYTQLVTLRGANLQGTRRIFFQIDESLSPTASVTLDPRHPNHGSAVGNHWAEFGSYLFLPAADCYSLQASWPGGQWKVIFAAGT